MSAGAEMELFDVLSTVEEFASASLELIAWEFSLEVPDLWPLWRDAVAGGLLEFVDKDSFGEEIYRLTAIGMERLELLRRRMAG